VPSFELKPSAQILWLHILWVMLYNARSTKAKPALLSPTSPKQEPKAWEGAVDGECEDDVARASPAIF